MTNDDAALITRHDDAALGIVTLTFNRPDQRNAMTPAFFDALEARLAELEARDDVPVVVIAGNGPAFCAGFDLGLCVEDAGVLESFIRRLGDVNRRLRQLDGPVVAAVHGHALAGGCALVSACDFSVAARDALLGYPVHRIGVSPAVTLPTLMPAMGDGAARWLTLGGQLISGEEAHAKHLVTHLAETEETAIDAATSLARTLAGHGRHAMKVTKAWLNELEGSDDDVRFARPAEGSVGLTTGDEAVEMLASFWAKKTARRS